MAPCMVAHAFSHRASTRHQDRVEEKNMSPFTIREGLEALKRGTGSGLVRYDQHGLVIVTKQGLGFAVHLEWYDQPPEDFDFLEENHLLAWWNLFMGEWLL